MAQNHKYFDKIGNGITRYNKHELNTNGQLTNLAHCLRVRGSFREMVGDWAMSGLQLVSNILDLCHQPKLEQHMLLHTHVSLPHPYPVKQQASAHPSKQPLGRSTLNFGEAILPGMRDDVRLGTNLPVDF